MGDHQRVQRRRLLHPLGHLHRRPVQAGGPFRRQELVGVPVDQETAPEAAQDHIPGVAPGEQNFRPGKQARDHRQVQGVHRLLVDEHPALKRRARGPHAAPVGRPQGPKLGVGRRQQPVQPVRAGEAVQGVCERRLLFQDLDLLVPFERQSEQARARAGEAQQEDMGFHPGRFRSVGAASRPAIRRHALQEAGRPLGRLQDIVARILLVMEPAERLAGMPIGVERLLHPVLGIQGVAEIAEQPGAWPGRGDQAADARLGGGGRAFRHIGQGRHDRGGRMIRRRLEHRLGMGASLLKGAEVAAQGREAGPGGEVAGLRLQRARVASLGLDHPPEALQRVPLVGMGVGIGRFELKRRFSDGQGLGGPVQPQQTTGQGDHHRDVGRQELERPLQIGNGLGVPLAELQRHRQDAKRRRMLQARIQGLFREPGGALHVPGVERRQDGVDARVVAGGVAPRLRAGLWDGRPDPESDRSG